MRAGRGTDTGGAFPASAHEMALDKLTMLVQQKSEEIARSLLFPVSDPSSSLGELPNSIDRASKYLGFDAASKPAALAPPEGGNVVSAFMATVLDDADGAAVLVTLGAAIGVDVQAFDADTAKLDVAQEWTKQQNFNATGLTDGANIAWDLDDNQVAAVTLGGNRTLDDPTNMKDGATYILIVTQDGTGSRTLAYGSAYLWPGGTAPTLSTGANAVDILTFISDGTSMFGVFQGDFS
jgi:hypothetical protein